MAICNRDKDVSEQKDALYFRSIAEHVTGASVLCAGPLPYPCTLQSVRVAMFGASTATAVQIQFQAVRFAGGLTTINLGISNMLPGLVSLSGLIGFSGLAAVGSSLLSLQAGDILSFTVAGTNASITNILIDWAVKKTQDIVSYNGVQS